jgi:hypothetical protein
VCTGQAGYISVIMTTLRGTFSFFPPPGRTIFLQSQLEFMTNTSGGSEVPCPVQTACMQGVKRISIRATKASIQKGLEELFLTYVGDANYYGRDRIDVNPLPHILHPKPCLSHPALRPGLQYEP